MYTTTKPRRRLGAVLLALIAMLVASLVVRSSASASPSGGFLPPRPVFCWVQDDKCRAWDKANRLQDAMDSLNQDTRAAAMYTFWAQFGGVASVQSGGVQPEVVARYSYRNDDCGQQVYLESRRAVAWQYNTKATSFNSALWGDQLLATASPLSLSKVGAAAGKAAAAHVGGSAARRWLVEKQTEQAIEWFAPNPYSPVLTQAIGVGALLNTQGMLANTYYVIRMACSF